MNHFHKHPIARRVQAQLAHMNALHYCAVLGGAGGGGGGGGVWVADLIWVALHIHDLH